MDILPIFSRGRVPITTIAMKRPLGVTMLALLIVLYGLLVLGFSLFGLALALLPFNGQVQPELVALVGRWSMRDPVAITVQLALGVFALVSGISMLRLRPWSWLLGMLLLGCELTIQLVSYFQGHPAYLALVIPALLVFYLNQRLIREAFHMEPRPSAELAGMDVRPVGSADAGESPGALEW